MALPRIKYVSALLIKGDSDAYNSDKQRYHWIDDHIAAPTEQMWRSLAPMPVKMRFPGPNPILDP